MDENMIEKAKETFNASFDDQDKAVDEAPTENELRFAVAYYTGFRDAIRELFPEVDMK